MPRPADVIVVGAGIVGCAIAYELARRGASVRVVEERTAGMGATQASAGMLAPYVEGGTSPEFLELLVRSLGLFDDFIARVQSDSQLAIPYRRTGSLQVAVTPAEVRELENAAARLAAQGVGASLLDAQTARAEEPHLSRHVIGALVVPLHGFVAAGALTRALAAAASRYGVQMIEGSRVRRIASAGGNLDDLGNVIVETDRGLLRGSAVVLAAGSWSGQIEIAGLTHRVPVRPIRGQLVRLSWNGPALRRVLWSDRCYVVPWDDGTLLVGATMEDVGFDERTTAEGVRGLIEAACELIPEAGAAGFLGARAGLRPASTDMRPIIGASRVVQNLMYATAHHRNGVLLAPLTAVLVADAMLDDRLDPALETVSPQRFGEM